jgi:Ca2+-transporting ATPase
LYHSQYLKRVLETRLPHTDGIRHVTANPLTGNVLILYNGANSPEEIAARIDSLIREQPHVTPGSSARRPQCQEYTVQRPAQCANSSPPTPTAVPGMSRTLRQMIRQADEQPEAAWHLLPETTVLSSWQTSREKGLSAAGARERLQTYGPNVLPESLPRSEWSMFLDQLTSVPVALLVASAGVSLLTGGLSDAVVILGVVAVNATIGYVTESQSEKTIHSLKHLVTPVAVVIRDGLQQEVSGAEVVPGDVLVLKPGSYVAADCRLCEVQRLSVDESTLTGESLPVNKTTVALPSTELPLADRVNMVYMGTLVTGGQGVAVVVATGRFTEIGKIQALAGEAQAPETPMERQLEQLGTQLVLLSGAVCGLVFGIGIFRGYGVLTMLKSAIALAVAAVPEGLPTVATTTLALGIHTMRRHHVLIRRLDAVETLGCVQTICLDKTGTLTVNRMSVVAASVGLQRMAITDSSFLVGGTPIDPLASEELMKLARVCVLCSETVIERHGEVYVLQGSATETALIRMAVSTGLEVLPLRDEYPVVVTLPIGLQS